MFSVTTSAREPVLFMMESKPSPSQTRSPPPSPSIEGLDTLEKYITKRRELIMCGEEVEYLKQNLQKIQSCFLQCMMVLEYMIKEINQYKYYKHQEEKDHPMLKQKQQEAHQLRDQFTTMECQLAKEQRRYDCLCLATNNLASLAAKTLGISYTDPHTMIKKLDYMIRTIEAPLRADMNAQKECITCPICQDHHYTHILTCCGKPICQSCTERLPRVHDHMNCPFCRTSRPRLQEIRL